MYLWLQGKRQSNNDRTLKSGFFKQHSKFCHFYLIFSIIIYFSALKDLLNSQELIFILKTIHNFTFRNFSSCLYISGSSSSDTFFIHMSAPLYSVRALSILFIVTSVSDTARYRNVSTSWYSLRNGLWSARLEWSKVKHKLNNH